MIEIEQPIFIVDEQTITAGELADGAIAVQVREKRREEGAWMEGSIQVTTQSICLVGGDAEQLQCLEVRKGICTTIIILFLSFIFLISSYSILFRWNQISL